MHILEVLLGTFLYLSLTEAKAAAKPSKWKEKCEIVIDEVCTTINEQKCKRVENKCDWKSRIDCYTTDKDICFKVDITKCTIVEEKLCLPDTEDQECITKPVKISETTCDDIHDKPIRVKIDSLECTENPEIQCITTYDARCDQQFIEVCKPEAKSTWVEKTIKVNEVDCHSTEEKRCTKINIQVCKIIPPDPGWKEWKEPSPEDPGWKQSSSKLHMENGGKEKGSWGNKNGGKYCRTIELQHCKHIHFKKCDQIVEGEPGWEKIKDVCSKATRVDCTMKPQKICFNFPDIECHEEPQEICLSFPVQTCTAKPKIYEIRVPGHIEIIPHCKKVPITNCHIVPLKKCINFIHTECKPTSKEVSIPIPSQDCRTVPKTISIPECHTKPGPEKCLNIPITKCHTVKEKQCIPIPISTCEVIEKKPDCKPGWETKCSMVPREDCQNVSREVCPEPDWKPQPDWKPDWKPEPVWKHKGKKH